MSECYVEPSTSRVAITTAFKKARRKFPKNFGTSSNTVDNDKSSENEDSLSISKNVKESESNCSILQKSTADQVDFSLIDSSLETVDTTDKFESPCNDYQQDPDDDPKISKEDSVLVLLSKDERMDSYGDQPQQLLVEELNDLKNDETRNPAPKHNQQNYIYQENHQNFNLIWRDDVDQCNDLAVNLDSEVEEESKIYETPRRYYDQRQRDASSSSCRRATRRRRCSRRSRASRSSAGQHSCAHSTPVPQNDRSCELDDESFYHSPDCPYYYSHCAHCHHHHHHRHCHQRGCCCCRGHCCCGCSCNCARCGGWQDLHIYARHRETPTSSFRRRSKKCPTCKRQQQQQRSNAADESPKTSSSRRAGDTRSRDSGIFTAQRYENDELDYGEEDEEEAEENDEDDDYDASSNALLHKDSLSILQEKFAAMGRRSNGENKKGGAARAAGHQERGDDVDACGGVVKNRKICRRLFSRCSNSY